MGCLFFVWNEYIVGTRVGGAIGMVLWALLSACSRRRG